MAKAACVAGRGADDSRDCLRCDWHHARLPPATDLCRQGFSSILGVLALLICGLAALASITSRALPAATNAPQVGQKAPDFTLADTNGNKVSLGQLLGKADAATKTVSLVAPPKEVMEKLGMANQSSPVAAGIATPPKAVLLVFYRGYW